MSFPEHIGGGTYELSDGTHIRGKQTAIEGEVALGDTHPSAALEPFKDKPEALGPTCPRCGESGNIRVLSAGGTETAEFAEPSHRAETKRLSRPILTLPSQYVCGACGKRFKLKAA